MADPDIRIREACEDDAAPLLSLMLEMEREFPLMFEPGERPNDPALVAKLIRKLRERDNSTFLVATDDEQVVGFLWAEGGRYRRIRKTATLVVSPQGSWTVI